MNRTIGCRLISTTSFLLAVLVIGVLSVAGCSGADPPSPEVSPPFDRSGVAPASGAEAIKETDRRETEPGQERTDARVIDRDDRDTRRRERKGSGPIVQVSVGPARQECYGPFRRMCLVVDGQYFYNEIDGFHHEPGYEYKLRIERYDAFPGEKEPPQDTGIYGYRLVEVVSKTRADGSVWEVTVAPTRVQCPKSDQQCLLVDGRPLRNSIDGFDYQPGFDYLIRLERFDGGTRRLVEVLDQSAATGTVEEIEVGPWRVGCYEDAPISAACIVVNGEPYYGTVEGHARHHGYEYRLRVEKYDLFPETAPPPEQPKYGYRLLKVLWEEPAKNPP